MKTVGTADLKAHLSEHLQSVRRGETITVLDRKEAIARIVPMNEASSGLVIRPARGSIHDLPLPGPVASGGDIVATLLHERRDRL